MSLDQLLSLGFDLSYRTAGTGERNYVRVRCSHCAAATINGVPCHEIGCPNAMHECKGCDALLPRGQLWCGECA